MSEEKSEGKSPSDTLVAVTGGSGFIGSHIVKLFLEQKYKVRCVVRDLSQPDKVAHLKKLPQQPGQLTFEEAKIESGVYGDVLKGVDILIHTASPYIYTAPDPQRDIVDAAIKGTVDAINAAIANKIRRVVITSSSGAATDSPLPEGYVVTSKDWNKSATLNSSAYLYSKRLAEQAAWKLYEENKEKVELVVINPVLVLGPTLSSNLNTSLKRVKSYLLNQNAQMAPNQAGFVDVRDVALAHLIAATHPDAVGKRLLVCSVVKPWKALPDTLRKWYPNFPVFSTEGIEEGTSYKIDTSELEKLGMPPYRSFETMLRDTIESFFQHGIVENKS
jgi:nucleoside-diphosphate-sugar epimerase